MVNVRQALISLGKLLTCALALEIGTIIGGIIAVALKLPIPKSPAGADMKSIQLYMLLVTPLYALALAIVARGLRGNFLARTLILFSLAWVSYTLNTELEASIVSTYATGIWFALISAIPAALFCAAATAYFFPVGEPVKEAVAAMKEFFSSRSFLDWVWRFVLAAVAFMPIYFVFGLMVLPFTGEYYRQSMFGLAMPTLQQLLPTLFARSVLFSLVCLPILILWNKSNLSLFWNLGLALFLLVGFIYMMISTWLPLYVRFPHTLEMLADEFVYAGALVLLIAKRNPA